MILRSPAFAQGGRIPSRHTCDGENIYPPLEFSEVPENTRSLALVVEDPDAPNGIWLHWLVWNIDPATRAIEPGKAPAGSVEGVTSFGQTGYGGPCPPSGVHRYFFILYALDSLLDVPAGADRSDFESACDGHIISRADLIGIYSRNN